MLEQMGAAAKAASYKLALLSSREKNRVLEKIADYLESQSQEILLANEQESQAQILTTMGCHEGQGYLFAQPLELPILLEHLHSH